MLKREISEKLKLWRTQKNKKALCIIGARQIGKTTIIREFAKQEYENFIEINFILDKGAEKIFEDKLDADTIIENLTAFKMQKMEPGKTLVFLDEIQECPNARCAIKFLVEDGTLQIIPVKPEIYGLMILNPGHFLVSGIKKFLLMRLDLKRLFLCIL